MGKCGRLRIAKNGRRHTPAAGRKLPANRGCCAAPGRSFARCRLKTSIEIMRMLPVEPVTGAPTYVRGLSIIRGAPVPVVDLGVIVSGEPCHAARLVTVKSAARIVALAVEAIVGRDSIRRGRVGPNWRRSCKMPKRKQ